MDSLPPVRQAHARAPLIIGVSLKMYFDPGRSVDWARRVAAIAAEHPAVRERRIELFVLPSLPALPAVIEVLRDTRVRVGAQDLFHEDRGAYTGGVSGADLRALGCTYVEVGHAERRRWFGEDGGVINLKLVAALRNGLVPVLCVGERTKDGVESAVEECLGQLESALYGVVESREAEIVVAYEPEWAIGKQQAAAPDHVRAVTTRISAHLAAHRSLTTPRVIYGGSAGPGLLPKLGDGVDGLFLGRFAHDSEKLRRILDDAMVVL